MASNYNIGDEVMIVSDKVIRSFKKDGEGWMSPEGLYITEEMLKYCRSVQTICDIKDITIGKYDDDGRVIKKINVTICKLEDVSWSWTDSCFEPLADFDGMEDLL